MERRHLVSRLVRPVAALALAVAAAVTPASLAAAAWSPGGAGGAVGAAATLPKGSTPSAAANGLSVTVSWGAAGIADGTTVGGYTVSRYNATSHQQVVVGGSCAGVVGTTTCTELVPPGTWVYTDTPVQANWTGGESPQSAPVLALG